MSKFLLAAAFCFMLACGAQAQQASDSIAVVITKTGETYEGTIIEDVPHDYIKIKTTSNSLYQLPTESIRSITYPSKNKPVAKPAQYNSNSDNIPASGAYNAPRPQNAIAPGYYERQIHKRTTGGVMLGVGAGALIAGIALVATAPTNTTTNPYTGATNVQFTGPGAIIGGLLIAASIPTIVVGIVQLAVANRHLNKLNRGTR